MTTRRSIGDFFATRRRIVSISARYTRFVVLLKVALPIGAAALVGFVVAWPYLTGPEEGFHLSFSEVGVSAQKGVHMTNVRFFNSDSNDQPLTVTAEQVMQDNDDPDVVRFIMPAADIQLADGMWLALTARQGALHRTNRTLSLVGSVNLFSDEGYELRTEQVDFDLRAQSVAGNTPVEGQGPLGVFNADSFRLDRTGRSIHFEGRVHMVLYPKVGA